jgi:hypothetical protein
MVAVKATQEHPLSPQIIDMGIPEPNTQYSNNNNKNQQKTL